MSNSYPILYPSSEVNFTSYGLGTLSDYIDWNVTEARNGIFELNMTYPLDGIHYNDISLRRIILAKPNPDDPPQPFRIYEISKPLSGRVKIFAEHISYDLKGIPVNPFSALNAQAAVNMLNDAAMIQHPFTMHTDLATVAEFSMDRPRSYRAVMGGEEGSFLDIFGGEYKYDKFDVYLYLHRGQNRGVTIRYGKNLKSLQQQEKCNDVYTGIMAYWLNVVIPLDTEEPEETLVYVKSDILNLVENPPYTRIYIADLTEEFDTEPTTEQLNSAALSYAERVGLAVPDVSLSISYEQDPELMETVKLCDTVSVHFEKLGVSATAKIIKTVYNGPTNKFTNIEIGSARNTFAKTLSTVIASDTSEDRLNQILESREIVKRFEEFLNGYRVTISDNNGKVSSLEDTVDYITAQLSDYQSSLEATITNSQAFLGFKSEINGEISSYTNEINSRLNNYDRYIRFTDEPAIILAMPSGSQIKLKLVNDKIFFFSGDDSSTDLSTAFAYITNEGVSSKWIKSEQILQIGKDTETHWMFHLTSNGNLVLDLI